MSKAGIEIGGILVSRPGFWQTPTSSYVQGPDVLVIGPGYVGPPLVAKATRVGLTVGGYDACPAAVRGLNPGRSHVADVFPVKGVAMPARGFCATADEVTVGTPSTIVIGAPTPPIPDTGPDLATVRRAVALPARLLQPGSPVVLESTTYHGTTDEFVRPLLEKQSGLGVGLDFSLAFSPERIDPGNTEFGFRNTVKVFGSHTPSCPEVAAARFYGKLCDQVIRAAPSCGVRSPAFSVATPGIP